MGVVKCDWWLKGKGRGGGNHKLSIFLGEHVHIGGFDMLDLSVYRPVNQDRSSQFTDYKTHEKKSWNCNNGTHK